MRTVFIPWHLTGGFTLKNSPEDSMKTVSSAMPHKFIYDFEAGVWKCQRCPYETPSMQIAHPGCSREAKKKALTA